MDLLVNLTCGWVQDKLGVSPRKLAKYMFLARKSLGDKLISSSAGTGVNPTRPHRSPPTACMQDCISRLTKSSKLVWVVHPPRFSTSHKWLNILCSKIIEESDDHLPHHASLFHVLDFVWIN